MMKQLLKTILFYRIAKNKPHQGFTLTELLVVIIIVGILATIAFPNFLKQIGKAREVEIKNTVGSINRAQQAYHWEKGVFAQGTDDNATIVMLNLNFNNKYIDTYNIIANSNDATVAPTNSNYLQDQTRAYSGGVFYSSGNYNTVVCQSQDFAMNTPPPSSSTDCGTAEVLK